MRLYGVLWATAFLVVTLTGTAAAFQVSPTAVVTLLLSFAVVGAIVSFAFVQGSPQRNAAERARAVLLGGVIGSLSAGAFAGHAILLGEVVFVLAALMVVASPPAARAYVAWLLRGPHLTAAQIEEMSQALSCSVPGVTPFDLADWTTPSNPSPSGHARREADDLRSLTDEQLCRKWRSTYQTVRHPDDHGAVPLDVIDYRQWLLDELERRHSVGFAVWLASSPRSAGSPLPYLRARKAHRPRIDWNQLISGQDH